VFDFGCFIICSPTKKKVAVICSSFIIFNIKGVDSSDGPSSKVSQIFFLEFSFLQIIEGKKTRIKFGTFTSKLLNAC
jgi:hypothetical protein